MKNNSTRGVPYFLYRSATALVRRTLSPRCWTMCTALFLALPSTKSAHARATGAENFALPSPKLSLPQWGHRFVDASPGSKSSTSLRPLRRWGSAIAGVQPKREWRPRSTELHQPPAPTNPLTIRHRHFPRALEISVAVLGVGAVVMGGVLEGMHGKCLEGNMECTSRMDSQKLGRASWIVGSQLLVTSLVFLIIDEWPRRGRRI